MFVILQLLLNEHCAHTEGQTHGPVPRRAAAEPAPETGGLELSCQALEGGSVVAVPSRQESLRLSAADRGACTEPLASELGCDSASRSEETQLEDRATQIQPPGHNVPHRHYLPGKVTSALYGLGSCDSIRCILDSRVEFCQNNVLRMRVVTDRLNRVKHNRHRKTLRS